MKISIIGAGNVGVACGFAILYEVKPEELILIDINKDLAEGEALDLSHINLDTKIIGGDISLIKDSDFVVITAGKPRTQGMTREDLFEINSKIVSSICEDINKYSPNAKVLIVTNPSTKLAKLAKSISGRANTLSSVHSDERTCGDAIDMGLKLDTARLKYYLKQEGIENPKSIVRGEHGDNMEFVIRDPVDDKIAEKVKKLVLEAGTTIISLKGYTNWGIASSVAKEIKILCGE